MKSKKERLNNIIGQVKGVKKMLDNKSDCIEVLTQLKAVRSAVGSVMDYVVEEQFESCMSTLNHKDKELFKKIKTYVAAN